MDSLTKAEHTTFKRIRERAEPLGLRLSFMGPHVYPIVFKQRTDGKYRRVKWFKSLREAAIWMDGFERGYAHRMNYTAEA